MRKKHLAPPQWLTWALALATIGLVAAPASAMPNLARQYGVTCNYCHTVIPKLNRTGYEFRRAGFREPHEIGLIRDWEKKRDTNEFIGANYMDARLQMNASYLTRNHATASGGYSATGDKTYNVSRLEFTEFTLYPLTGGFLGHWATESEISGETDNIEVENGYLRYTTGKEGMYWQARFGIFHPFEGYGASDRVLGLSRPLFQAGNGAVNAKGDKNGFTQWGFDQVGLEGGFQWQGTSLNATVFNGLIENAEDPAQGPHLRKQAGSPTENSKDFQLFFNQFLGKSDAAISAYYYNGKMSLGSALYEDKFDRWTIYGSVPVQKFLFLGGYSSGSDKDDITHAKAKSKGYFVEADLIPSESLGAGLRFDTFDPSDRINKNDIQAVTAFVNLPMNNGLQFIAELKSQQNEKGVGKPKQTTNSINFRVIYIW